MTRRSRLPVVRVALVSGLAAFALGAAPASGDTGPPVSTSSPSAAGAPGLGKQLRTSSGSWSTSATVTYQWLRCDAYFASCTNIPGAIAATYTVVDADVGHVLGAAVTATNASGSAVALSNGLGPVAAAPPEPRHKPAIAGKKRLGERVYETADKWAHSPDTFAIRWLRCSASGGACVRITGKRLRCAGGSCARVDIGTQWDYTLTEKDMGHRLRVRVSASNGAGRATAISKPTRLVKR
jgi:hypothetical protein